MRNLLALGIILGLAACTGDDAGMDDLDTETDFQEPAPAPMPADTMTLDTMGMDTMGMDTMTDPMDDNMDDM